MAKRSVSVVAVVVALLVLSGGAAAALGVSFSQIQFVSFGDVEYQQSELTMKSITAVGPGTDVVQLDVVVDNPASGNPTATIEVWLLDDDTELTTGNVTESFTPGETTVAVLLEDTVRESNYDSIDVRITEE
jgi:hypothetical protein